MSQLQTSLNNTGADPTPTAHVDTGSLNTVRPAHMQWAATHDPELVEKNVLTLADFRGEHFWEGLIFDVIGRFQILELVLFMLFSIYITFKIMHLVWKNHHQQRVQLWRKHVGIQNIGGNRTNKL